LEAWHSLPLTRLMMMLEAKQILLLLVKRE
jgi:hypothetical protein